MIHQNRIVTFCCDKKYAGIFADYGTGKTLAALMIMNKMKWNRILVVSTKLSLLSTWIDEIKERSNFRYSVLMGTRQQKIHRLDWGLKISRDLPGHWHRGAAHTTLFLLNYDGIKNIYHELTRSYFDAVFLDESTKIKSSKTERTKICWSLGREIKHRFIMAGFPVTENLVDLYSQVKFLDNGTTLGNRYDAFVHENFVKFGPKIVPKAKNKKLILKKIQPFCIRVTNKDLNLPPQIYKQMTIKQTKQQKELLDDLTNSFSFEFGKVKYDTQYIFGLINKSMQICDGFVTDDKKNIETLRTEKDETLVELLDEIDPRQNKVVIWCAFLFSIHKIERILKRLKIPTLTLTGASKEESSIVRKFQHSKSSNVLLTTQKKSAESISIQNARIAIYYSQLWSGDLRANSEARIRRKGSEKHKSILYIDFMTENSVEIQISKCHRQKKSLINELKRIFTEVGGGK